MRHSSKIRLTATILLSLSLVACATNKRRERSEMPPERKQDLYERMITRWDVNHDGAATCADVVAMREELFIRLDTNNDKTLSPQEYRFAQFEDKSFLFYPYDTINTDDTAAISFAEFSAVPHSEFSGMDRDKNCTVSVDEAAESLRNQFRNRGDREGSRRRPAPKQEPLPD